jgi:hypothetical protein
MIASRGMVARGGNIMTLGQVYGDDFICDALNMDIKLCMSLSYVAGRTSPRTITAPTNELSPL